MTVNKSDIGASQHSRFCKSTAHFATGMIGDETYGVKGFPCSTGSNENFLSHQVLGESDFFENILQQNCFFRHSSIAAVAIGQHAAVRSNYLVSETLKLCKIILNYRIVIHVVIHRRSNYFFTWTCHNGCSHHVVCNTSGNFSDNIG